MSIGVINRLGSKLILMSLQHIHPWFPRSHDACRYGYFCSPDRLSVPADISTTPFLWTISIPVIGPGEFYVSKFGPDRVVVYGSVVIYDTVPSVCGPRLPEVAK